jgi:hypothetical protein
MTRPGFHHAAAIAPADDLRLIKGIGPAIERRLQAADINTFAKLGSLKPAAIAQVVPGRSATRIAAENWIGQARQLASERAPAHRRRRASVGSGHQHYATFTVELLLNDDNSVRRTRVRHVQSKYEETWVGWDSVRIVDSLVHHAGFSMNLPEPASALKPLSLVEHTGSLEGALAEASTAATSAATSRPDVPPKTVLESVIKTCELAIVPWGSVLPCNMVPAGQPFSVRLAMDLTEVTGPLFVALGYMIKIRAKKLGKPLPSRIIGEGQGTFVPADKVSCAIETKIEVSGAYRLSIEITLALQGQGSLRHSSLSVVPIAKLLQVY